MIGFIILAFGTIVYNEILVIPYWGFDQNTKEAIKKRAQENLNDSKTEDNLLKLSI